VAPFWDTVYISGGYTAYYCPVMTEGSKSRFTEAGEEGGEMQKMQCPQLWWGNTSVKVGGVTLLLLPRPHLLLS